MIGFRTPLGLHLLWDMADLDEESNKNLKSVDSWVFEDEGSTNKM